MTAAAPQGHVQGYSFWQAVSRAIDLPTMTQGQGDFTMEFAKYRPTPGNIQKEIIEERKKAELALAK